jgi:hypothetical protein
VVLEGLCLGSEGAPGEKANFDAETMALLRRISDLVPDTHKWLMQPPGGNILQVNLKAKYSPYVVVDPRHVAIARPPRPRPTISRSSSSSTDRKRSGRALYTTVMVRHRP